ncbi:hypothetical protein IGI04_039877 [Brassica rapa subsp. trilocularis]|uniref:Uncharacterized protein n=1 Tax=Brassica rapa subsp. trilocularis TaxID=1813537 RepID=A0ABQ7KP66_BRACM|nr:hypothetical protein IGI04_039877 [Brassica rapa subsp. trilocularis]
MQQIGIYRYYNLQHLNSGPACMPCGTRSNKEKDLLFSDDPAHLERTIRRGQRSTSLDATTSSPIDTHNQPSTDTRPSSSIDPNRSTTIEITPRTSIDTVSSKIVNVIILTQDENGNLYDQDGHLSMSLGGSQWCRPMSMNSHQSTDHDEDRWTDYSSHRSTSSAKSTECNAVRILTHEEFAAKHPNQPTPFYDKIDRSVDPTINRQSESVVDRHNTPPIDRQAPLTYRVRLPSIDIDYINALNHHLNQPIQEDQETERRRLRKRKEKIPKNLKREANDKEMDSFTKRILRIPIEKPFDEAYFTHRLWMFFRETKVTEEDIRRMFHQVREKMRHRITLSKKSDPGKFAIPCVVKRKIINSVDYGKELGFIGACHCGAEYETESSESIDTHTFPLINSNESTVTDERNNTSLDVDQPVDHFALPNHCCQHFAFQPPSKRGRDDYSIDSWADSGFHESFAVDNVITSPNEEYTEEYDEDYWKERAIEISLQDKRFETHKFTNTFPTSFDEVHSTSVDTYPRPAKQPLTSIDTHTETSIDIHAAAKIQEQENIPSPTRFTDTYLKRFAPLKPPPHTRADTQAEKMNTLSSTSTGKSMKSNHLKNTSSAEIILPSIDASVSTSIDTTLKPNLSISKLNDNANIDYGFLTPDEFGIFRDPDGNACAIDGRILQVSREDIANILQVANGPDNLFSQQHLSCQPKGQASIDGTTQTSIDRITPTSTDKDDQTSIDRRYEFGYRAFDMYGARKFTWERRDEYGVYRDECGHARGEKLEEELKSLVEDTHQPLDRSYNELFRNMVEMTEIESLRQQLEKEATNSASIDAPHAPSIDVSLPTAQIPAEPQCSAEHKDEWEVSYINTRINDVYYPLNNNVDWLSTKIELLQQDVDTIRKKDQQPATSIDVCTITSLDAKISAMDDRLQAYEDMHDRFANSFSIDRLRGPWIDGKNPVELLSYTAAEVDKITSKIYTAIDNMEEQLDKRCDGIYFPFDNRIGGLDSHAEWLQKEVKAIQRQLAAQHQISASTDKKRAKSPMVSRRDRPMNT